MLCPATCSRSHPSADDAKSDDVSEGRLNGDREALEEMDESKKEDKNGFKAKFMFNIADGGFTGKNEVKLLLSSLTPGEMAKLDLIFCSVIAMTTGMDSFIHFISLDVLNDIPH